MSNAPTSQDRASLIKHAASLPKGSPERKAILASINKSAARTKATVSFVPRFGLMVQMGSQILRITVDAQDLRKLEAGMLVSTEVDLPINDETPLYVRNEVNAVREELSSTLARLTAVTKQF